MAVLPDSCDVLIIGAGPTGLAMGIRLRQLGVDCLIVERQQQPSNLSKAVGLHARSLEVLDVLGVREELEVEALRQDNVVIYNEGNNIASLHYSDLDAEFPYVLCCSQSQLENVLAARYSSLGGRLLNNLELTQITQDHGRG